MYIELKSRCLSMTKLLRRPFTKDAGRLICSARALWVTDKASNSLFYMNTNQIEFTSFFQARNNLIGNLPK